MTDFACLIVHPIDLDIQVFHDWILGLSAQEVVSNKYSREPQKKDLSLPNIINDVRKLWKKPYFPADETLSRLEMHVYSQYRTFKHFEHFLARPKFFLSQSVFSFCKEARYHIIESYYSFDECLMQEVLGKKLSSRLRRDLEEIAVDKLNISISSVRRQYENLKRLMKRTEESSNVAMLIEDEFCLPKALARKYTNIIFILTHKLDTNRRKLAVFKFSDFIYCAGVFQKYWIKDLSEMAQDVREVKALFRSSKDLLEEYHSAVKSNEVTAPTDKFKTIVRNVLSLGAGLSQSKEMRDIFVDLVEKIVEPCLSIGYQPSDLDCFFQALLREFSSLSIREKTRYHPSFARLLTGIQLACLRLFKRMI